MKNLIAAWVAVSLLAACSSPSEEEANNKSNRKELAATVNQPLDKAKAVEQQILDNVAQQKKQLDDM